MAFLPENDDQIKKKLGTFLRKQFKSKVTSNKTIFISFAPTYHLKAKNKKERIVLFRSSPVFPDIYKEQIRMAVQRDYGVYLAIAGDETNPLVYKLQNECDKHGVGIIHHRGKFNFFVLQNCVSDYPREKPILGRPTFFVSSKLGILERDLASKILKNNRHQPILVERVSGQGLLEKICFDWIKKCKFFIGIITPHNSELVRKEIKKALKKDHNKCQIYIRTDTAGVKDKKLKELIDLTQKKARFRRYGSPKDFAKKLPDDVASLLSQD